MNLTTVLAHASGEWIASDWPVCRLADTAAPHRMGAALTYARRYALFTLVGIAGEDDLDAPDLNCRPPSPTGAIMKTQHGPALEKPRPLGGNGRDGLRQPLSPDASAALRDQLVHEIASLGLAADAAQWARTALQTKNMLTAADARMVEVAFGLRLSYFDSEGRPPDAGEALPETSERTQPSSALGSRSAGPRPRSVNGRGTTPREAKSGIDKSVLPIGEPRRYRDRAHLEFVASQSCLVCGRRPCDPHHLRFAQRRALGRRVSDEFTVPLCRLHHRELHRSRDERVWWSRLGLDSVRIAELLWKKTRLADSKAATGTTIAVANVQADADQVPPADAKALAADDSTAKSDAS